MNVPIRPLFALVRKDLLEFLSDRRAVIMSFIAPVLLASFMALVMGGAGGSDRGPAQIDIRIVDQDESALSRKITQNLADDENLKAQVTNVDFARESVRKGQAAVAVILPKGFGSEASRAMFRPDVEKPQITFLYDPTHQAEMGMVRGILTQHVMQAVASETFGATGDSSTFQDAQGEISRNQDMPPQLKTALQSMFRDIDQVRAELKNDNAGADPNNADSFGSMGTPFKTTEEPVTAGNQESRQAMYAHAFSGMAVQFILFSAIEMGVGLLTERQRGLWKRFRAAPLSRVTLLGSRTISGSLIALLITAVVFAFGAGFFGIRIQGGTFGFLGFGLVALAFALTASTFGLLIAALGKTPQAARGVSILVVLLMLMLGGAWVPSFLLPSWLRSITTAIPTRWAVDGFDLATIRANSITELLPPIVALLGFATLFGLLALFRFRWDTD